MQICGELQTLSVQELRQIETTAHDLRKIKSNPKLSEQSNKDDDLDFDEDGWLRPKPEHVKEFMEAWQGCLANVQDSRFLNKKVIRTMRLEEKYGGKTSEERRVAAQKFYDTWNGALESMPDMTAKEIHAERLEEKYGK
jgi:hypothetical protein